jgi:hypothetical protein
MMALESTIPNLTETLQVDGNDSLDLGRHSEQILMRDKTIAY